MDKEFLVIVGNGKPTGSVLKKTIAVSVTILISVQKWHSRIRLRVLSCNRMREMRREPEVPEERVPVGESFDCHARITSKELAQIHSVKSGILQHACSVSRIRDSKSSDTGLREHSDPMDVGAVNSLSSGKGKGSSGPRDGCFKCVGAHFQRDCNASKNNGKQSSGKGKQSKSWSMVHE